MDNIGIRLKRIRKEKGFSLRGLGKAAHVSHSFIADIESGRSKPSLDTLDKLAKALDVYILELTGNSKPNSVDDGKLLEPIVGETTDPELLALCNEFLCRKDLQQLVKQVRGYDPETVRKLVDSIRLVEKEGQH
ncbi:MAG TPA: helix-turn-helix transcriptional regulator [Firmicutes bacterium]|nr:helix-turn-helix transcriptional regulator [Bacillota bacterium]